MAMYKQVNGVKVKMSASEEKAVLDSRKPKKNDLIDQLWNSCDNYVASKISVSGMVDLSPNRSTGKAKQIHDWVKSCWADYYSRRAQIEAGNTPSFDFSNNGELPTSYLEARMEIDGL